METRITITPSLVVSPMSLYVAIMITYYRAVPYTKAYHSLTRICTHKQIKNHCSTIYYLNLMQYNTFFVQCTHIFATKYKRMH